MKKKEQIGIRQLLINRYMVVGIILVMFDLYLIGSLSYMVGMKVPLKEFEEMVLMRPFNTLDVLLHAESESELKTRQFWLTLQIPFFFFFVMTLYKLHKSKSVEMKVEEAAEYGAHGTSRWATEDEIEEWWLQHESKVGLYLGQFNGRSAVHPTDWRETDLNQCTVIFGASGAKKSRSFINPNVYKAMYDGLSIVVTDTKGAVYNATAKKLRKNGYKVYTLNFLKPAKSDCWNILDTITDFSDVLKLAQAIMDNTRNPHSGSDEVWGNAEKAYLQACILYILRERPDEERHMPSVLEFGVWGAQNPELMDQLFDALPNGHDAKKAYALFQIAEEKMRKGIQIGFSTRLQVFLDPGIAYMWSNSDFDLKDLGREKIALFLLIKDSDTTYEMPVALVFSKLYQSLYDLAEEFDDGRCPVEVRVLKDEFNNIGVIGNFERITSTCRSRGIYPTMIVQGLSQFKNRYNRDRWSEIIGNCDTIVFMTTNEMETAEYFSRRLDKTTIQIQSQSDRDSGGSSVSRNFVGRNLLTPGELIRWDRSKIIVMQNGRQAAILDKVDFEELEPNIEFDSWIQRPDFPDLSIPIVDYDEFTRGSNKGKGEEVFFI